MNIFWLMRTSTPKAKRTPLELDFIIAAGLALVAFYLVKRAIAKFFPNMDEQLENFIPMLATIGVFALVLYLFNL